MERVAARRKVSGTFKIRSTLLTVVRYLLDLEKIFQIKAVGNFVLFKIDNDHF